MKRALIAVGIMAGSLVACELPETQAPPGSFELTGPDPGGDEAPADLPVRAVHALSRARGPRVAGALPAGSCEPRAAARGLRLCAVGDEWLKAVVEPGLIATIGEGDDAIALLNDGDTDRELVFRRELQGAVLPLSTTTVPYQDGRDCVELDPVNTPCSGRGPNGEPRFMRFPAADPRDGYVGNGYRITSNPRYQYIRRAMVQLVRYGIRRVQRRHSGTLPITLIDMSQQDGYTPGTDVGAPRHPTGSHRGDDIDIAYYNKNAATWGYSPARVICDANGGSNDGQYCTSAATTRNVVDLPRQVTFMAALFESPLVRVIGVDYVIRPLIRKEAERQYANGWISATLRDKFYSKVSAGSGWPYHHHHIHVSMYRG